MLTLLPYVKYFVIVVIPFLRFQIHFLKYSNRLKIGIVVKTF